MCGPYAALATLALGTVQAVQQRKAQNQAIESQNQAIRNQQIVEGQQRQVQAEQLVDQQEAEMAQIDKIARKEQAQLAAAATASGATGNVLNRALTVSGMEASQALTTSANNSRKQMANLTQQGQLSYTNAQNSMQKKVGWKGTALQIAGSALQAGSMKVGTDMTTGADITAAQKLFKK